MALGADKLKADFVEALRVENASPATVQVYEYHLREFLAFLVAERVKDIRHADEALLRAYKLHLEARYPRKFFTLCVKVRAAKRFFTYLVKVERMLCNPARGLKEPSVKNRVPRSVLNQKEALKVLEQPSPATPKGCMDRAILETLYATGLRLSEIQGLGLEDADLKGGVVTVRQGKGAKDRVAPLGPHAIQALDLYLRKVRPFLARKQSPQSGALWLNHQGLPLSRQIIARRVRRYGRQAGLGKKVSPHVWRHSFATGLVNNGADIRQVQELLGHARATTTAVYCRVTAKDLKEAHAEAFQDPGPQAFPKIDSLTSGHG